MNCITVLYFNLISSLSLYLFNFEYRILGYIDATEPKQRSPAVWIIPVFLLYIHQWRFLHLIVGKRITGMSLSCVI